MPLFWDFPRSRSQRLCLLTLQRSGVTVAGFAWGCRMYLRRFSTLPSIVGIALLYFIVGKLCLTLAFVNASASPVWPPTGTRAGRVTGSRLSGLAGHLYWRVLVNATTPATWPLHFASPRGNTLEALCAAWLINRFAKGRRCLRAGGGCFQVFALPSS